MKIYVDQGVNLKDLKELVKTHSLQVVHVGHYEQKLKGVEDIPGVFMLNVSTLNSGDYLAGDDIHDVTGIMKPNKVSDRFDVAHLYSAYSDGCEYFVTNNPKDFIRDVRSDRASNGRREELEQLLTGLKIVTLEELTEIL